MSGTEVHFVGPAMDVSIRSLGELAAHDPVLVGGIAVMCRLGGQHRPTIDIDSVFDNPDGTPTTEILIGEGLAQRSTAPQRVLVGTAVVDIIDTFGIVEDDLPDDDPGGRLFACAHRHAFETGSPITLLGDSERAVVRVATVEALVAMKAHALRWGRKTRRSTKRSSDLADLYLLAAALPDGPVLLDAPWSLAAQVRDALNEDLADIETAAALLRSSAIQAVGDLDPDVLAATIERLLQQLS